MRTASLTGVSVALKMHPMDTLTHDEQIDLALVRRQAARTYVRSRHALRMLVNMGAVSTREARAAVIESRTTWLAARTLLKGV